VIFPPVFWAIRVSLFVGCVIQAPGSIVNEASRNPRYRFLSKLRALVPKLIFSKNLLSRNLYFWLSSRNWKKPNISGKIDICNLQFLINCSLLLILFF